jgi:hypothetical protein
MDCRKCGSSHLEKIGEKDYRCVYCGTITRDYGPAGSGSRMDHPVRGKKPGRKKVLLAAAVAGISLFLIALWFVLRQDTPDPSRENRVEPARFGKESMDIPPPPEAVFDSISVLPDSIGNVYFLGKCKNTGKSPVKKPEVVVVLFKGEKKVATGKGYAPLDYLLPGEETPVKILLKKPPSYDRYEIRYEPEAASSYQDLRRGKLQYTETKLSPGDFHGYRVAGEAKNVSDLKLRFVRIVALLYDENGKITGMGNSFLKQKRLVPGDYEPFQVDIYLVKDKPASFELYHSARIDDE